MNPKGGIQSNPLPLQTNDINIKKKLDELQLQNKQLKSQLRKSTMQNAGNQAMQTAMLPSYNQKSKWIITTIGLFPMLQSMGMDPRSSMMPQQIMSQQMNTQPMQPFVQNPEWKPKNHDKHRSSMITSLIKAKKPELAEVIEVYTLHILSQNRFK